MHVSTPTCLRPDKTGAARSTRCGSRPRTVSVSVVSPAGPASLWPQDVNRARSGANPRVEFRLSHDASLFVASRCVAADLSAPASHYEARGPLIPRGCAPDESWQRTHVASCHFSRLCRWMEGSRAGGRGGSSGSGEETRGDSRPAGRRREAEQGRGGQPAEKVPIPRCVLRSLH